MIDIQLFTTPILFRTRPRSIPGDFRPVWRISVILLILSLVSRGRSASLGKPHLINWALQSKDNQDNLKLILANKASPNSIVVRIEPSLNRAIDLASGEGLVEIKDKNIIITASGEELAKKLIESKDVLLNEKEFLLSLGKNNLTETIVSRVLSRGE